MTVLGVFLAVMVLIFGVAVSGEFVNNPWHDVDG